MLFGLELGGEEFELSEYLYEVVEVGGESDGLFGELSDELVAEEVGRVLDVVLVEFSRVALEHGVHRLAGQVVEHQQVALARQRTTLLRGSAVHYERSVFQVQVTFVRVAEPPLVGQ